MIEQPPKPDVPKPPDVINHPPPVNLPVPPGEPETESRPDIHPVPPEICEKTARQYEGWDRHQDGQQDGTRVDPHTREWRALLQRIEPSPATSFRD